MSFVFKVFFFTYVGILLGANSLRAEEFISLSAMSQKTNPKPWLFLEANSEQRQPLYVGLTPYEKETLLKKDRDYVLPQSLEILAKVQLERILRSLHRDEGEFELWPVRDDYGALTWTFSRWRDTQNNKQTWQWLDGFGAYSLPNLVKPPPFFPVIKNPAKKEDYAEIFYDLLDLSDFLQDLYVKPLFGDCVWTNQEGSRIYEAWLAPTQFRNSYKARENSVCRWLPQPARLNGVATSFSVVARRKDSSINKAENLQISWPDFVTFPDIVGLNSEKPIKNSPTYKLPIVKNWLDPNQIELFQKAYEEDVRELSGEEPVIFPLSHKDLLLTRKNSAMKDHQLELMVDYLEERYLELGITTFRDRFKWKVGKDNIVQSNLIAVIPGEIHSRPILMADHIDTAFQQDTFDAAATKGQRVSAPGADDNVSAVAALLQAAVVLKDKKLKHDVWLVHITGEEFPADDLGARRLTSNWLKNNQEIGGIVLLDMIGYNRDKKNVFQLSAGDSPESVAIAELAHQIAVKEFPYPLLDPKLRRHYEKESYLYNTDGIIFSDAGFPVVLFNEHLNAHHNLSRKHYHESTDTVEFGKRNTNLIDFKYASSIVRVAIETVAQLAMRP